METVYDFCPKLDSEHFKYQYVTSFDVDGMVRLYSDEKTVKLCNFDNINENCFEFYDKAAVIRLVRFWQNHFRTREFLRYTVIDIKSDEPVGSLEMFRRMTDDEYLYCCMLRIDLLSKYEHANYIEEILSTIMEPMLLVFDCYKMATKILPRSKARKLAIERLDFDMTPKKLIGIDGEEYDNYYMYTQPVGERFGWDPETGEKIFIPIGAW